ncbi:MAG: hypothetical protein ACYS5V_12635, partial [Planctomycetota bacterium]
NLTLPGGGGDTDALQKQEIEELIEIEIDAIDASSITSGPTFPSTGEENELFFNTTDGRLYIYYNDGSSSQWVDASPDSQASVVTSSPSPPANPNENDLWFDEDSGKLFIYYKDLTLKLLLLHLLLALQQIQTLMICGLTRIQGSYLFIILILIAHSG